MIVVRTLCVTWRVRGHGSDSSFSSSNRLSSVLSFYVLLLLSFLATYCFDDFSSESPKSIGDQEPAILPRVHNLWARRH